MMTLAIIGTAGRGEDYYRLTSEIYFKMVEAAKKVIEIEKVTNLVSGGAAWADNVACELDLPKKLYIPDDQRDLGIAKYYHTRFRKKVPNAAEYSGELIYGGTFKTRNLCVANEADIFLAITFGNGREVKDGGTKHTVDAMLKQGKRGYHLDLNTLKLYDNGY